jgi:cyclophilin family peptidyl-prolyl cis-trans isomerase
MKLKKQGRKMRKIVYSGLLVLVITGMCFTTGCQEQQQSAETQSVKEQVPVEKAPAPEPSNPIVDIKTNMGVIRVKLFPKKAPETVKNFLKYVDAGFYDGTIFHRVMSGFMIQGGGYTEKLQKKLTAQPIVNECSLDLRNKRGTISMARTRMPHTATSQFFINHVDNPALDHDGRYSPGYAVFGKVIEGMDVVDQIAEVQTQRKSPSLTHLPVDPVVIQRVERVQ